METRDDGHAGEPLLLRGLKGQLAVTDTVDPDLPRLPPNSRSTYLLPIDGAHSM